MASDPTTVGNACKHVFFTQIEDVFVSQRGPQQVASGGVGDTLRGPRRSRRVEQEQNVFRVHGFGRAVGPLRFEQFFHGDVTAHLHLDVGASALKDEALLHERQSFESFVHNLLQVQGATSSKALVTGHNPFSVAVFNSGRKRAGTEASENDAVRGSNASASKHREREFRNHWHVDCHGVSASDSLRLQGVGDAASFAQDLSVREALALAGFICFPDERGLVTTECDVPVDAVHGHVQLSVHEPRNVAMFKSAHGNCVERSRPVQRVTRLLAPESVGIVDGLLVHLLVHFHFLNVGPRRRVLRRRVRLGIVELRHCSCLPSTTEK
mmetsp:Transcript_25203/g.37105  ORF Transcript_25203/g.37105 Transcript_25203/m.37105 type:complete len:325 (-) Transcript_25203:44-1018(-)